MDSSKSYERDCVNLKQPFKTPLMKQNENASTGTSATHHCEFAGVLSDGVYTWRPCRTLCIWTCDYLLLGSAFGAIKERVTSVLCRRNKGNLLQIFLKGLYFSDRPKGLSARLFICPVFQSCNKSDNVGNKIGTTTKKSVFTCASNTCFSIISVVSFPKCFFEPLERRKHNCKDVCGSLCLLQILKSEDSLLSGNYFVKKKNKYYPENSK